jgi:hypothetical protein
MNKILVFLIASFSIAGNHMISAQDETYKILKIGFENPPNYARPKVYWWCLNGNIDTIRAKQEFLKMKMAGIGGFDLFEIGVPKEDTMIPGGPAFLSDESLKVIKFAVKEAGKLGLEMGLNLASSWNAGGAWTLPENAGKSLYYSEINAKGGFEIQNINVPFPEISFPKASLIGGTGKPMIPFQSDGKPVYYEEVAVLAIPANTNRSMPDTTKIINISGFFNPEIELLIWKVPPGNWRILRYVCSNSGQQLVLPSPNSAGLTIDHFDSTAVRIHLMHFINSLKPVLGDFRNTALKSFYLASYEARGFVWTSSLPAEFKKVNGYDIYKFLPSFFDPELFDKVTTQRIQTDFKKTLSELMINNLYKTAKKICNNYGLKINCEAGGPGYPLYNGPAEPLKALGALDIPRGEFWVNHSRYYPDDNGKDSIDILRVVKEVAAASHIYERGIVEEESFTSFQHWQEGPFDIKPVGDRAFCEGMNRVVFHGFSHNPAGTGYPGIVYHAGTHFNDKRVWWPKIKPFVDYISRASYIFREAEFVSDVVYYYGDKIPNAATAKNTHFTVGPGYDYEVINTEILLNSLTVKNKKLILSNGAEFSILALENMDEISPVVFAKLGKLSEQGAIIVGERPKKFGLLKNQPDRTFKDENLLNQLWTNIVDPSKVVIDKNGKIYSGLKTVDMLNAIGMPPDINYQDKESFLLDYIHYKKSGMDFYFIRNTTDRWISRECGFRQQSKVPEIWNPMTGEIVPVPVYNQDGKYIKIPISLAPYGSYFVVFVKGVPSYHYTNVSFSGQYPPLMEFTRDGILFLNEGTFVLKTSSGSKQLENKQKFQVIDGEWKVSFSKGWGAPDSVVFSELTSWTNNKNAGIRYYSGTGTYHKSFNYEQNTALSGDQRIFIDLGNLSKVAELWLNGRSLGIAWAKPFKYDITGFIKNGRNILTVEIANTWSNRLTGDAITGEKFTSTNIKGTNIPGTNKTNIPWAQTPLIESGLFGPVTIQTVTLVK